MWLFQSLYALQGSRLVFAEWPLALLHAHFKSKVEQSRVCVLVCSCLLGRFSSYPYVSELVALLLAHDTPETAAMVSDATTHPHAC